MHLYGLIIGLVFVFILTRLKNTTPFFQIGLGLSCLIGARLYHVFDYWKYYSVHPIEIFYTWNGGLGIFGALLAGFVFIFLYSHLLDTRYHILDTIIPWLPLAQSIGRLGNYFNHEISTWWIESLANLTLFIYIRLFPTSPTAKYLIGYGLIRFCFEFTRADTWTIQSIHVGQLLSLVFIISGITLILWQKKHPPSPRSK